MAILHDNSTNYFHSYEPNTTDLTMAMDYDTVGQPFLRTVGNSTYFGEHFAVPLIPVIQLNSYEGIKTRDTQIYTGLGGSVVESDSTIDVSCTSTVGSYGVYRSRRFIPYRSGQSCLARMLVQFDTPLAGTQQRVGLANQENAYYIGYNGTSFQFLHSYGGKGEIWELDIDNTASGAQDITLTLDSVAYTIAIANGDTVNIIAQKINLAVEDDVWLADQIDDKVRLLAGRLGPKTGTFSFASTGNVTGTLTRKVLGVLQTDEWEDMPYMPSYADPTRFNQWQFQYSWSGVTVQIQNPDTGRFEYAHRHILIEGATLPVTKPAFKPSIVCYNVGGSTGVTVKTALLMGAVEGREEITKYTHAGANTLSSLSGGNYWHIMSIQNPYVNKNYKLNYRSIRFLDLTATVQANDPVQLFIFFDQPKATGYNFNFNAVGDRLYQADITDGQFNVTADTPVVALVVGINGQAQFDLRDYNLVCPPGAHMSLVAYSTSNIAKITMAGVWATLG